jgi:hypothetical protein
MPEPLREQGADDEPEMSRRKIPSVIDREIYGEPQIMAILMSA